MACNTGKYDPTNADSPDSPGHGVVEGTDTDTEWVAIHHVVQTVHHRQVAHRGHSPTQRHGELKEMVTHLHNCNNNVVMDIMKCINI